MVRCTVSSHLDNQGTTTALTLHSRHHHYGDDHCCEGQHSTKESRREIMGLGREKHLLRWQANTGLSSFPKYARHIANPQVKSTTTASPPELFVEEEPWCAGGATVYFTRVKPRLGHVCWSPSHLQLLLAQLHLGLWKSLQAQEQVRGQPAGDMDLPQPASSPTLHLLAQEQPSSGEQVICHRCKERSVLFHLLLSLVNLKD